MGKLNNLQFRFTFNLAILLIFAYFKGYTITLGDAWAKQGLIGRIREIPDGTEVEKEQGQRGTSLK